MPHTDDLRYRVRSLLGLNDYEARAYLELLRSGPMKAPDLARRSKVPTGRIYDVLKSLEAKGLVAKVDANYRAIDPRIALEAYSARLLEEAKKKADQIRELAGSLSKLTVKPGDEAYIARGLGTVLRIAASTLSTCQEQPIFLVHKAAEKLGDLWENISQVIELLPPKTLIIVSSDKRPPTWAVESVSRRGLNIVFHPAAIIDAMIACDTVIIGVPSGDDEVAAVIVKSREFARGLATRLRDIVQKSSPSSSHT